jgi:hypothetical protein
MALGCSICLGIGDHVLLPIFTDYNKKKVLKNSLLLY